MKAFSSLSALPVVRHPVSLAVGVFDGFHRGHQQVVAEAEACARACGGETWLLTFEPNPIQILRPERTPPRLTTGGVRRRIAEALGLDGYIEHPFTPEFSHLTPEAFVELLLQQIPTLTAIVVGANWRFGFKARGDAATLQELGARYGFNVIAAAPVRHDNEPISSTRIRKALLAGDVASARAMLGRCYAIEGPVIHGAKTGRRLGFPTANVAVENELVPPDGIYAVHASLNGVELPGAAYRGRSSPGDGPLFEVHLLDFDGDLYGQHMEIHFQERQRGDRTFASEEALVDQIRHDVAAVRAQLAADCGA